MQSKSLDNRNIDSETDIGGTEDNGHEYHVRRSRLIKMINWWHVGTTFYPHVLVGLLCYLASQISFDLITLGPKVPLETAQSFAETMHPILFDMGWRGTLLILSLVYFWARHHHPVYLVDFAVFDPPQNWKLSHKELMECMRRQACFTEESLAFMSRILNKSGTGPATAWPPGIVRCLNNETKLTADQTVEAARQESETVICAVVQQILDRTQIKSTEIDILIVNCSLFSPTPSLCAMIMSKFNMRFDVMSYNISGMGCSASLIAIEMAQSILRSYPSKIALVVSTENLTQNLYHGNERSMLLQNTLFRCGGAAILLSNKWRDGQRAKYKLLHVVRTQGVSKEAYEAVYECEDQNGQHGVRLSKDIVQVAGRTMEKNFTILGPYVLPLSEQIKVAKTLIWKKVARFLYKKLDSASVSSTKNITGDLKNWLIQYIPPKVATYVPDFKRGIDHWCIHAGGRAVVDGIVKNLKLSPSHAEPSRYTLYHYGNTSSSSIWYELDYIRRYGNQKRGQRVLQVAFGSGFKCNTAVWLCLKTTSPSTVPPPATASFE
mmetsp:Transcript_2982/g.4645  ORF Transcript_2982/g.4645 Transcript_2982/m.4645 type:complete len:549 (-) Transcript_2982:394-2040(-)